jgi:hypothetical protein
MKLVKKNIYQIFNVHYIYLDIFNFATLYSVLNLWSYMYLKYIDMYINQIFNVYHIKITAPVV